MTKLIPIKPDMVLTDEAQNDYDDFNSRFEGCTCFLGHPPCGFCAHPGNPLNLNEDESAWKHTLKSAVRSVVENGKVV